MGCSHKRGFDKEIFYQCVVENTFTAVLVHCAGVVRFWVVSLCI